MSTNGCGVRVDQDAQDSREDLARRLELTQPTDTVRGLFFLGTLEAVRALAGEDAVRHCVEAGSEPRFVEFFNYPVSDFLKVTDAAARVLAPRCGGWTEALRHLGRRATADMLKSATGKALMLLSKGEARWLVGNLPAAYRAAVNHGERTVTWEGPSRGRILMRRDFMPCAFHEGVLLATLEAMKAREVEVRGSRVDMLVSEYVISWS
ncbi:DUF2378 family protein [Archangium violaceum]|uniref:DUF2378 family protein n=1 Tax=Archangium violaceum TaxID=83451 RepID=UPI00193C5718|nr:DUF2378 family protein [Archangium violaceum]QRK11580.1 DUF2378 family protein [Archangium violaceum]